MKKLKSFFLLSTFFFISAQLPEYKTITGTITSADDGSALPGVNVMIKGTNQGVTSDQKGQYEISKVTEKDVLTFSYVGYLTEEVKVGKKNTIDVKLHQDLRALEEVVVVGYGTNRKQSLSRIADETLPVAGFVAQPFSQKNYQDLDLPAYNHNTEEYATIHENNFLETTRNPLSTFSIDVDAASYSNLRRFINMGQRPPKDAVRIEEMINYFDYNFPEPKDEKPLNINTEIADCPWQPGHLLLQVALQGKKVPTENLPPSNLVFLIDVSGSMNVPSKLPLLKTAFRMLTDQLRPEDRVAMVVYAGAAGVVLESTPGSEKPQIKTALERLQAGGSTAGGAGIEMAYEIAGQHFQEGGNNRVILATDGDFNVGSSSNAAMERLIEEKRNSGIFLTVLGFGMGNYKDSKMEILANKGNGNYAYIDNVNEAKKVLVNEFGGTMFTIAKDVKLQLEFNPAKVRGYRLIGYENRMLNQEDFNDDQKDAGELGSGHTVTAFYEIIPTEISDSPYIKNVDDLKYQSKKIEPKGTNSDELLQVKLRYKLPENDKSTRLDHPVASKAKAWEDASENFRFAAAVASYGMILRDSEFKGTNSLSKILAWAEEAKGEDRNGYRQEFIRMVESSNFLAFR